MKTILLKIEDDVFKEITRETRIKTLVDNDYFVIDSFIHKLIKSVDDGKETLHLRFKDEDKKYS